MRKEVEGPKLRGESTIFGVVGIPRFSMIWVHKYLVLLAGAAVVTLDVYSKLPDDLSDPNAIPDPNAWLAFPFLLVAYLLGDRQIFIRVCRNFRSFALEEKRSITEQELEEMVTETMYRLSHARLICAFSIAVSWLLMFFVLLLVMFYIIGK